MKYEPIDWKGIKDLGKVPDRVIADRLGVSHTTVGYHRRKLGAGAYRGRAIDRYAAVSHLFGVLPDAQLARDLAGLYRPLLALQKDERSRVVDVVVATLLAE